MITAIKSGGITILIDHGEAPVTEKGKFVPVEGGKDLIQLKNFIQSIRLVIPDDEGTGARIIHISSDSIKRIHDTAQAILKEIPPPGNASDYDY